MSVAEKLYEQGFLIPVFSNLFLLIMFCLYVILG